MGILGILVTIETRKISIRVVIHPGNRGGCYDETFIHRTFQVPTNVNESQFMAPSRLKGVASNTLVDCKGNIWSGLATEVEQHADNGRVVERA